MLNAFQKILSALLIIGPFYVWGQHGNEENNNSAKTEARSTDYYQEKPVLELINKANILYQKENDIQKSDSIYSIAIEQAESMFDNNLLLRVYIEYIKCMDQGSFSEKRLQYALKAERINKGIKDKTLNWNTNYWLSDVYSSTYSFDKALEYSYKALSISESNSDEALRAQSFLSIGNCLEKKHQLVEAFRNYLQSANIAERLKDPKLLSTVYQVFSKFYQNNKDYDNALNFKLKQAYLLHENKKIDSLSLMWIKFELEEINFTLQNNINDHNIKLLLNFSKLHHEKRLWDYSLSLYRSFLINNDQFEQLKNLYTLKYPEELAKLKHKDNTMYFRILALINEISGKGDSALYCFNQAAGLLEGNSNKVLKASFYIRYGQFLGRKGKNTEAISMFEKAFQLSGEASYMKYAITSAEELEKAYVGLNDFRNAYKYSRIRESLSDSVSAISKKDDLLLMEIDNTAKQEAEIRLLKNEKTERSHNIQYTAITILIGIIFLILVILGSFKVPKWSIQFLGFISFILLFEFIVLIFDKKIEVMTHGEPWKVLGIKIFLIGILMPLHHLIERRVIQFLLTNRLINFSSFSLRKFLGELFFHTGTH